MLNGFDSSLLGWVLLGSALGGAARYAVSEAVARTLAERFPWGTLLVNVSGAVTIGVWFGSGSGHPVLHAGFVLGFLGSYTTVSSFALQTVLLSREGRHAAALAYALSSALLCLLAVAAGFALGAALRQEV